MSATAKFPTSIWDGSSATRSAAIDGEPLSVIERAPDSADWQQGVAEVIAIETALTTTTLIAGAGNTAALATTRHHRLHLPPQGQRCPDRGARPASRPATSRPRTTMPTTRSTCTTAAGRPPSP